METNQMSTEAELNLKLERVRDLLARLDLDALLLRQTANFAWATSGADSHINTADSLGIASLLITPEDHLLLTNNIEARRLMEEGGLADQQWNIKASQWYSGNDQILEATRGMKLGADVCMPGVQDLSKEVAGLRSQLTVQEGMRFRDLGSICALGMKQAAEAVRPGMSEYEIAGLLSQVVESRGVQAIVTLVAVDERIFSYRHPLPTSRQLQHYGMLVLCGRKWGLICSVTRLVYFGKLPEEIRHKGQLVAQIDAEMIAATRPGHTLGDVFHTAQSAYASAGFPDEWQLHHQGGSAGYAPREITATPFSNEPILMGQAFAWNPSITGAKSEDTILVGERSNETLTEMADWPTLDVQIGDQIIKRPAILEKE